MNTIHNEGCKDTFCKGCFDYERNHSHSHCWEQKESGCGMKGEHLYCCLCTTPNPKGGFAPKESWELRLKNVVLPAESSKDGVNWTVPFTKEAYEAVIDHLGSIGLLSDLEQEAEERQDEKWRKKIENMLN